MIASLTTFPVPAAQAMLLSFYKQVELNQTEKLLDRSGRVSLQCCVYLGCCYSYQRYGQFRYWDYH